MQICTLTAPDAEPFWHLCLEALETEPLAFSASAGGPPTDHSAVRGRPAWSRFRRRLRAGSIRQPIARRHGRIRTHRDPNDVYPKSNAAAEKALELDPALARPRADLASKKMYYNWDFSGGEADFRKALELDPSDATAHRWFAENLAYIGGRAQESIDEANRAHQLDPLSPMIGYARAQAYAADHQFDKAIEVCNRVIADNPTFGRAHSGLGGLYWAEHKYPQAIQEWKAGAQLAGDKNYAEWATALDAGFRSGGWPNAQRKGIEVLLAQRKAKTGHVSPDGIAELFADLGDKDHAFEWLNKAYEEHDTGLTALRTDFTMDSLRSDPRYAELVRKIGFPQ